MQVKKMISGSIFGIALSGFIFSWANAEPLRIGMIMPLTGPGAIWGQAGMQGVKIRADEINAQGGLKVGDTTYQIEITTYDDRFMAADAVAAYNRLVNQEGKNIVFMAGSASVVAVKDNLVPDKVLVLSTATSDKIFDGDSTNSYRIASNVSDTIPGVVRWIRDHMKERRVVLINPNDQSGWDQAKVAVQTFKDNGFTVLSSELFERSQTDFQALLTRVLAMKPEVIDLGGIAPSSAGLIVRQARELGYTGAITKTGAGSAKEILEAAGPQGAEGALNVQNADPSNEAYRKLVATYRKAVGQDPNELIVSFYDGADILFRALERAGTVGDTAKIVAAIPSVFPVKSLQGSEITLGGERTTGKRHTFITPIYISIIKNGRPVIVDSVQP